MNDQLEVAILLVAPMLLGVLALAPWLITLLYSSEFLPAYGVLRWQMLGDVLKVASWPLGYVILANNAGGLFLVTELMIQAVFIGSLYLLLPALGLEAAGVSFALQYVFYVVLVAAVVRARYGVRVGRRGVVYSVALLVAAVTVFALASWNEWVGGSLGVVLAAASGAYALTHVARHVPKLRKFVPKRWR